MKHKFERYCKDYENIENYEKAKADNFEGWCCHHRKGVYIQTEELQELGMYYGRPAEELIFLTVSEHQYLHKKGKQGYWKGKNLSEEVKKKISEANKGNKHALGCKHSEEAKKKIGEAKKGMHFFNNGKINIRAKECPEGFVPGRIKKP